MISRAPVLLLGFVGASLASPAETPSQETLSGVVSRFSQAWVDGDLGAIGSLMA